MQQGVFPPTLYESELDKLTTWQAERNNKQQLLPLILVKQDHLWLEWFISDNSNLLPSSQSRIPFPAQSVHTFVYQSVFCLALLQHHFLKQRNLQFRQICSYIEFPCIFSHTNFMWQGALQRFMNRVEIYFHFTWNLDWSQMFGNAHRKISVQVCNTTSCRCRRSCWTWQGHMLGHTVYTAKGIPRIIISENQYRCQE